MRNTFDLVLLPHKLRINTICRVGIAHRIIYMAYKSNLCLSPVPASAKGVGSLSRSGLTLSFDTPNVGTITRDRPYNIYFILFICTDAIESSTLV